MKLDPEKIEILVPNSLVFESHNQLSVCKQYVSVSASLVKKMGSPEYARFYIDRSSKQLFIVPCKSGIEGACKFYNKKSRSNTVRISSTILTREIAEVAGINLGKKDKYRFNPEEVVGRKNALGFDLTKSEQLERHIQTD